MNLVSGLALFLAVTGCQTGGKNPQFKDLADQAPSQPAAVHSESMTLREGNTLKLAFMGAPNLNNTVTIRPDGKINLSLIGEVSAAGMTPAELEKELKKRYKDQITVDEITVTVESNSFPVYVTGAVMHAQKVISNHPLTIIEAIMEAGGPDYQKANLKAVTVVRQEAGRVKNIVVNVKQMLDGKMAERKVEPFYMKPGDTIIVKEKFSWL